MESRSERRLVTSVFIDVVGSTEMGRAHGPERTQRLLSDAFAHLSAAAVAEGGTVEKYIGDEIFVLFGAPAAHADDVVRALRLADAAVRWSKSNGRLAVRVGIETGDAVVDLDAVGERQRMAVGTCVNVAARLQQFADTSEVLVGPTAVAAAGDRAEFGEPRIVDLKGLGRLPAARLIAVRDEGGSPSLPFVGRDAELERLEDAWTRADAGRATLTIVVGPPGIGKSRVADEFTRRVSSRARVRQTRCRPGTERGVSPLRELIAEDGEDVPPEVAHSAGLRSDPRLLALATLDRRQQIEAAWVRHLKRLGAEKTLLLRVEDLHWAESELVRLVERLTFESDLRLMVLATARPDFPAAPLVRPSPDHVFVELPPLDATSAKKLARAAGVAESRIERAAGHPLFIVELARGQGATEGALPVSVQAAISARLDELPPPERDLLQRAAVIGETFDVLGASLLADRDPAGAAGALGRLAHLRYVHPVDGAFRFDHALVHEIAYGRVPVDTRLRLHARYAREGLASDAVELLAHHWWEALGPAEASWVWEGNPELESMRTDAVRDHVAAGKALADRLAFDRMVETFERALKLSRDPRQTAEVEEAFGLAYARNARGDDSVMHRRRAVALYREAGTTPPVGLYADMLDIVAFNWGYFRQRPGFEDVLGLIDEGVAAARETGDPQLLRVLIQRAAFTGDASILSEVERILEGSTDLTRYVDALWRLGAVHFITTGDLGKAKQAIDGSFALARRGVPFNEPEALMWRSIALFHTGDLAGADEAADRLLSITQTMSPHTRSHAIGTKGHLLWARGDWRGVIALDEELRALAATPDATFCIAGANLAGNAAVAALMEGLPPIDDLETFLERLIPEAVPTRAAVSLIPNVMRGQPVNEDDARRAYAKETTIWDRETVWDVTATHLALAAVIRERWDEVAQALPALDMLAARGAELAFALAAGMREELAATRGGPAPRHEDLRRLGYLGVSQILSYRANQAIR